MVVVGVFKHHEMEVVVKDNGCLGLVKRNLYSITEDIKILAYRLLVRPTLEYRPII